MRITRAFMAVVIAYTSTIGPAVPLWAQDRGSFFKPGKNQQDEYTTSKEDGDYFSPKRLRERIEKMDSMIARHNARFAQLQGRAPQDSGPALPNVQQQALEKFMTAEEMSAEVEQKRAETSRALATQAGFQFKSFPDGRREWYQNGRANRIENEKLPDGSVRDTTGMTYDKTGNLLTSKTETRDTDGHITTNQWAGTYKEDADGKPQLAGFSETTWDPLGNISKTERTDIAYSGKQAVSYKDKATDSDGRISLREVSDTKYDGEGRTTSYKEKQTDPNGNTSERTWTAKAYEKNPAYDKKKSPNEPKDLIKEYEEETIGQDGRKTVRNWKDAKYDAKGRLTSYKEETRTHLSGGKTLDRSKEWSNATYDAKGRLTNYKETNTDEFGRKTTVEWGGARYDTLGRILTYQERTSDSNGNPSYRVWTKGEYNAKGQLLSYKEENTDRWAQTSTRSWRGTKYEQGQLTSYEEDVEDALGNKSRRGWQGAFDEKGRLSQFKESNSDTQGRTSLREQKNIAYDAQNRMASYMEESTDPWGDKSSSAWSAEKYDDMGRIESYSETRADTLGNATRNHWQDGKYDENGRLTSYREELTDDAGNVRKKSQEGAKYDADGNLASYREEVQESNGALYKKEWSGKYDTFRRMTESKEVNARYEKGSHASTDEVRWKSRGFDKEGQILGYEQTTERTYPGSDNKETITQSVGHIVRDERGRTISDLTRTGTKNEVTTTLREGITFYTAEDEAADPTHVKGQMAGYRQTVLSEDDPTKTRAVVVTGMGYNKKGGSINPGTTLQADSDRLKESLRQIDALGKAEPLAQEGILRRLGQLVAFSKDLIQDIVGWFKGNEKIGAWLTKLKDAVLSGAQGAIEAVGKMFPKGTQAIQEKDAGQDAGTALQELSPEAVNPSAFPAVIRSLGSFDHLLTVASRSNVRVDEQGRAVSWKETNVSSAAKDKKVVNEIQVEYEGKTQRMANYAMKTTEGEKLSHLFRTGFSYNGVDQAVGYREATFDGESLQVDSKNLAWNDLGLTDKRALLDDIFSNKKEVEGLVAFQTLEGAEYDINGNMESAFSTLDKRGYSLDDPALLAQFGVSRPEEIKAIAKALEEEANRKIEAETAVVSVYQQLFDKKELELQTAENELSEANNDLLAAERELQSREVELVSARTRYEDALRDESLTAIEKSARETEARAAQKAFDEASGKFNAQSEALLDMGKKYDLAKENYTEAERKYLIAQQLSEQISAASGVIGNYESREIWRKGEDWGTQWITVEANGDIMHHRIEKYKRRGKTHRRQMDVAIARGADSDESKANALDSVTGGKLPDLVAALRSRNGQEPPSLDELQSLKNQSMGQGQYAESLGTQLETLRREVSSLETEKNNAQTVNERAQQALAEAMARAIAAAARRETAQDGMDAAQDAVTAQQGVVSGAQNEVNIAEEILESAQYNYQLVKDDLNEMKEAYAAGLVKIQAEKDKAINVETAKIDMDFQETARQISQLTLVLKNGKAVQLGTDSALKLLDGESVSLAGENYSLKDLGASAKVKTSLDSTQQSVQLAMNDPKKTTTLTWSGTLRVNGKEAKADNLAELAGALDGSVKTGGTGLALSSDGTLNMSRVTSQTLNKAGQVSDQTMEIVELYRQGQETSALSAELRGQSAAQRADGFSERRYSQETKNQTYDSKGRLTGYDRTTKEGARVTQEALKSASYDGQGRMTSGNTTFIEKTLKTDGSVETEDSYDLETYGTTYDKTGRVLSSTQVRRQGDDVTVQQSANNRYDAQGRL
ncbi:MAG: hypothetical protein HY548_03035, partial [Elusimicrobia bacterium]|nr:hypothetical protein [Elusimicrobiota bacterium]